MKQLSGNYPLNQDLGRFPTQVRRAKDFRGDVGAVTDRIPNLPWDDCHQLLPPIVGGQNPIRPEIIGVSLGEME